MLPFHEPYWIAVEGLSERGFHDPGNKAAACMVDDSVTNGCYPPSVFRMSSASVPARSRVAALLALALALRLVLPMGFMPAFDHGAATVVACPDADGGVSLGPAHHHHGGSKVLHGTCPYAAAGGLGALAADFAPLLAILILAPALLLGRTFLFLERSQARLRPPTRGPPIPA